MKLPYLQFIFIGLVFPGLDALLSAWCFASTKEKQKTQLCHQSCPLLEQSLPSLSVPPAGSVCQPASHTEPRAAWKPKEGMTEMQRTQSCSHSLQMPDNSQKLPFGPE